MAALYPTLDSEWLAKLDANPSDAALRNGYFVALDAASDVRGELARLEAKVATLDLVAPERAALKSRRNALREAIAPEWRDRFGFGTRPGCDKPLPWPEETAIRWLSLYEYIEECRGVWLPASAKPPFASHGSSVTAWENLLNAVSTSSKDYAALFRDAISLEPVPGWPMLYSLMVQGEADFHWAVAHKQQADEDPPVHGLTLDYEKNKFVPTGRSERGPYGCFARVTDFVRAMFEAYDDFIRSDRFILHGSKAPAKPFLGWDKPLGPKPTATDLGTAQLRAAKKTTKKKEKKPRATTIATASQASALTTLEIRDAIGNIRTDLDENSLLQGIKKREPKLVGKSLGELLLRWTGSPTAKLVYRLSDDGRYMVTHIDAEGIGRTAIADGDPKQKATVFIAGEPKTRPGDHFILPVIAAALAERFLVDGGRDPCVEWQRSTAHL